VNFCVGPRGTGRRVAVRARGCTRIRPGHEAAISASRRYRRHDPAGGCLHGFCPAGAHRRAGDEVRPDPYGTVRLEPKRSLMSNLLTLDTAGQALDVYQQALNVVQTTSPLTTGYVSNPDLVPAVRSSQRPRGGVAPGVWIARATSTRRKRCAVNCSPWAVRNPDAGRFFH